MYKCCWFSVGALILRNILWLSWKNTKFHGCNGYHALGNGNFNLAIENKGVNLIRSFTLRRFQCFVNSEYKFPCIFKLSFHSFHETSLTSDLQFPIQKKATLLYLSTLRTLHWASDSLRSHHHYASAQSPFPFELFQRGKRR